MAHLIIFLSTYYVFVYLFPSGYYITVVLHLVNIKENPLTAMSYSSHKVTVSVDKV